MTNRVFLIGRNKLRLKTSIGTQPAKRERSSSADCEKRERFTIIMIFSFSQRRRNASTFGLSGFKNSREPRENALKFFRMAITRRVHHNSDERFFCWFSTLIASKGYWGSLMMGRKSFGGF